MASLGHNELTRPYAIWRRRIVSILIQVMPCKLTAQIHYMSQCGLIIKGIMWHSPGSNFTRNAHDLNPWHVFGNQNYFHISHGPMIWEGVWTSYCPYCYGSVVRHSRPCAAGLFMVPASLSRICKVKVHWKWNIWSDKYLCSGVFMVSRILVTTSI